MGEGYDIDADTPLLVPVSVRYRGALFAVLPFSDRPEFCHHPFRTICKVWAFAVVVMHIGVSVTALVTSVLMRDWVGLNPPEEVNYLSNYLGSFRIFCTLMIFTAQRDRITGNLVALQYEQFLSQHRQVDPSPTANINDWKFYLAGYFSLNWVCCCLTIAGSRCLLDVPSLFGYGEIPPDIDPESLWGILVAAAVVLAGYVTPSAFCYYSLSLVPASAWEWAKVLCWEALTNALWMVRDVAVCSVRGLLLFVYLAVLAGQYCLGALLRLCCQRRRADKLEDVFWDWAHTTLARIYGVDSDRLDLGAPVRSWSTLPAA